MHSCNLSKIEKAAICIIVQNEDDDKEGGSHDRTDSTIKENN